MFGGFISIRQNNLDSVLAYILIKEIESSSELHIKVPVALEKACIILSMGVSSFQS